LLHVKIKLAKAPAVGPEFQLTPARLDIAHPRGLAPHGKPRHPRDYLRSITME
jgi:hypothetical protein